MATQVALDAVAQVFGTSGIDVAEYGDHDRGIAEGPGSYETVIASRRGQAQDCSGGGLCSDHGGPPRFRSAELIVGVIAVPPTSANIRNAVPLDLSTTYYGFRRRTMALSKSTNTQFRCYLSRLIRPPILIIAQDFD